MRIILTTLTLMRIDINLCPFCGNQAHVKPTTTHRLMLRCDMCETLVFANAEISQCLLDLLAYRGYY